MLKPDALDMWETVLMIFLYIEAFFPILTQGFQICKKKYQVASLRKDLYIDDYEYFEIFLVNKIDFYCQFVWKNYCQALNFKSKLTVHSACILLTPR